MKVALVHDYLREFGGAERVLKVLTEMYPNAPIYTAFSVKDSTAEKEFRGKDIRESFLAPILKIWKLYSPLRFLTPLIWGSMDLSSYDLVITSSSWYITRGFKTHNKNLPAGRQVKVICYCHTPPRWLYGYETSVGFTKYWPVKVYSTIVGYFMKKYDFKTARKIDYWIANSKNVQGRIKKYYKKDSVVIYPPIDVEKIEKVTRDMREEKRSKEDYFLTVSRLVGAKGLEEAVKAFKDSPYKLKIVGEAAGFSDVEKEIRDKRHENVEFLGRISDEELYKLYADAKALICLARDEDFGMTPVEAMAAGTPVIAFNGGGYKESVINGKTGIFVNKTSTENIKKAVEQLNSLPVSTASECIKQAEKFSKERFEKEISLFVKKIISQ
jgi:glycosyltransferase involved in cell wall biosynthesis